MSAAILGLLPALLLLATTPAELQALVDAGRLDEAEAALLALPEPERAPWVGQIAMKRGAWPDAVLAFEQAEQAMEAPPPELYLYLALCYLRAGRAQQSVQAAERASALAEQRVAQPLVEARARREVGDTAGAYRVLERAARAFPHDPQVRLELVALLQSSGLLNAARRVAVELAGMRLEDQTRLTIFDLLHRDPHARPLLEWLAAAAPEDPQTTAHLAHHYAATGESLAAARLFARATAQGGDFGFEAADQFRVAGRVDEALEANAEVHDVPRRQAQRLAILFEGARYARVVALARRGTLPAEPASSYRIAYAHYALGEYAEATRRAEALLGTDYEASGQALLRAMGREGGP